MRLFAAAFVLSTLGSAPVLAQDAGDRPFAGGSVTVIGGVGAERWADDYQATPVYGLQLGYSWQRGAMVLGIETEAAATSDDHCDTVSLPNGGHAESCQNPGRDLYAGARVGTTLGTSTMLYVKGGLTNVRLNYLHPSSVGSAGSYVGAGEVNGFRVGAGIEQRLNERLSLKAEYRYSNYEGSSYTRHQAVLGLGLRF